MIRHLNHSFRHSISIVWILILLTQNFGQAQNSDDDYVDNDYGLSGLPHTSSSRPFSAYGAGQLPPAYVVGQLPSTSGVHVQGDPIHAAPNSGRYDPSCPSFRSDFEAGKHPCTRICEPGKRMRCEFNFKLEYYLTNSAACGNCTSQNVLSDCKTHKCILADGVRRVIAIVNDQMPGPSIRVCEGDTLVVTVENDLDEGATIHWHGLHQKGTPFMDGVPGITQCVIPHRGRFKYEFTTPIFGTYFWHSHSLFQRSDGVYGSLIVRRPPEKDPHGPKNGNLYDCDLPEHELIVMDWQAQYGRDIFANAVYGQASFRPTNALINGKGFPRLHFVERPNHVPTASELQIWVEQFEIETNKRYRLRIISNAIVSCPFQMSIERHKMTVIASDGFDLQPEVVDSLVMYPGERWDVVIKGDQPPGAYWIKFRGLNFCRNNTNPRNSVYQVAILRYKEFSGTPNHVIADWIKAAPQNASTQLNSFNTYFDDQRRHITVAELKSLDTSGQDIVTGKFNHQFFLPFDFNQVDTISVTGPHAPAALANVQGTRRSPQINHVSYVMPKTPLLTQPGGESFKFVCNNSNEVFSTNNPNEVSDKARLQSPTCVNKYCACTHLLKVAKDDIVELVLVDIGVPLNASHPFHLHGHSFRVTDMQKLGAQTSASQVREHMNTPERIAARQRALAPIKDTINVHDGGYTVIRFKADNPGFWFFHCHVEFHSEVGMGLVFQVGEREQMTPTPPNFPTCGTGTGSHTPPVPHPPGNEVQSISLYEDDHFKKFNTKVTQASASVVKGRSFILTGKSSWTIFEQSGFNGRRICIQPSPRNGQYLLPRGWSGIGSVQRDCREVPNNIVRRQPFK